MIVNSNNENSAAQSFGNSKPLKIKILVVDDNLEIFEFLKYKLLAENYLFDHFLNAADALKKIKQNLKEIGSSGYDVILSDLKMPGMSGIEFSQEVRKISDTIVIMMSAYASVETAVEAMRVGADHYIIKPIHIMELKSIIQSLLKDRLIAKEAPELKRPTSDSSGANALIGKDPRMETVLTMIRRVAHTSVNVLLFGESGTGKELIAKAIHKSGPRGRQPFVALNCTAIPENLLESELFGHAKGAFTGAISRRKGLVEAAEAGTLFLDEIGDMPMALQGKLLRFIQEREYKLVGENNTKKADVRIIAASHRNLKSECKAGRFREDLYYRLNVVYIEIPTLNERAGDISLLAKHFLKKYSNLNPQVKDLTPGAIERLSAQDWPGNIRELENAVERAMVFCQTQYLDIGDFEYHSENLKPSIENQNDIFSLGMSLEELDHKYIDYILKKTVGKKDVAAKLLGINRKTLYRKEREINLAKLKIDQTLT